MISGKTSHECHELHECAWKSRFVKFVAAFAVVVVSAMQGLAQDKQPGFQTGTAAATDTPPMRIELGGYYSWADRGYGDWRGLNANLWYRGSRKFVPGFLVDSQTRPEGTQQNYSFMSYLNWTPSFYTVQGVSGAPQRSEAAIFFPKFRADVKGNWKLTPGKKFVLGTGFTYFDFGRPGKGEIYNVGALYYRNKLVVEGNLFINRSQPGNLWSSSGSLALQYGAEGKYWIGFLASGGQELYRVDGLTPFDARLKSYTIELSYRRWISRHVGYYVGAILQEKIDAYRRGGGSARLFFEF